MFLVVLDGLLVNICSQCDGIALFVITYLKLVIQREIRRLLEIYLSVLIETYPSGIIFYILHLSVRCVEQSCIMITLGDDRDANK